MDQFLHIHSDSGTGRSYLWEEGREGRGMGRREEEGVTEHMYDTGGERGERVERGRREESISVLSFFVVLDWKRVILISTTVEYTFEFYRLWPWKEGGREFIVYTCTYITCRALTSQKYSGGGGAWLFGQSY